MEKVKVKSVKVKKEGVKNGKAWKIYEVQLEDGRTGDSFNEFKEGEEVEIEIKPNANAQYAPNFKRVDASGGTKKGFGAPKDYTFEKKRVALECAVALINGGHIKIDQLESCRDRFFTYLNEK